MYSKSLCHPLRGELLASSGLLAFDDLLYDFCLFDQECTKDPEEIVKHGMSGRTKGAYRDFTQSPHREPPYARRTVFMRLETVAYWRGRSAGTYRNRLSVSITVQRSFEHTPGSPIPQSPHLG